MQFPRRHYASLQELASQVIERRGVGTDHETFSRDLLAGFQDVCTRIGLDGVLAEISFDDPALEATLIAKLGDKEAYDPRGPRNAKPKQLADCLVTVLHLELFDPESRAIAITGEARTQVARAIAGVLDVELASPRIRDAIIAAGRARCEERHVKAYEKLSAELDDRGMRINRQLKLPLDSVQAVQKLFSESRVAVVAKAASLAIDRAKAVLAAADPAAAERIDAPISLKLTPREVAIARVTDPRTPKAPEAVAQALLDALGELADLAWQATERIARPYGASQTFVVGELLEHPKFGLGTVKTVAIQRIEVEFAEATHTLVHARK